MLTYVPVRKPMMPKQINSIFFQKRQLYAPIPGRSQNVTISIIDGNIRPNVLKQTAPINEINGPICGIATAMKTVTHCK